MGRTSAQAELQQLKDRYTALYGKAPRGSRCNEPSWLRNKIAEKQKGVKGEKGNKGDKGEQGEPGPPGPAAVVIVSYEKAMKTTSNQLRFQQKFDNTNDRLVRQLLQQGLIELQEASTIKTTLSGFGLAVKNAQETFEEADEKRVLINMKYDGLKSDPLVRNFLVNMNQKKLTESYEYVTRATDHIKNIHDVVGNPGFAKMLSTLGPVLYQRQIIKAQSEKMRQHFENKQLQLQDAQDRYNSIKALALDKERQADEIFFRASTAALPKRKLRREDTFGSDETLSVGSAGSDEEMLENLHDEEMLVNVHDEKMPVNVHSGGSRPSLRRTRSITALEKAQAAVDQSPAQRRRTTRWASETVSQDEFVRSRQSLTRRVKPRVAAEVKIDQEQVDQFFRVGM
eukprot:SAG11_NODE_2658_length_3120_cov_67.818272_3_plen_398_part_00